MRNFYYNIYAVEPYSIVVANPTQIIGSRLGKKNRLELNFRPKKLSIPDNSHLEINNLPTEECIGS